MNAERWKLCAIRDVDVEVLRRRLLHHLVSAYTFEGKNGIGNSLDGGRFMRSKGLRIATAASASQALADGLRGFTSAPHIKT